MTHNPWPTTRPPRVLRASIRDGRLHVSTESADEDKRRGMAAVRAGVALVLLIACLAAAGALALVSVLGGAGGGGGGR